MVKYVQVPSPNFTDKTIVPKFIVIHYTASSTASSAVNWLSNPTSKVSAHIVMSRTGECTQMVPFDKKAWHAGPSAHSGWRHLNNHSIGIELVNTGHQEYPEEQLKVLDEVIADLKKQFPTIFRVVGHSEIDTETDLALKKTDPGPQFPMDRYRIHQDSTTYQVTASKLNVRAGASGSSTAIRQLMRGDTFSLLFFDGKWARMKEGGFVHRNFIRQVV